MAKTSQQPAGLWFRPPQTPRARTVLRIPGSHTLYVGPPSCMRRHALHHRKHGDPSAVSFLRVSQTDVVSGSYEKLIVEAVDELERTLVPPPSILFINLFCIDDFLGTDADSLRDLLAARWPGTRFVFDRIHPVALSATNTMSVKKTLNLYSFLDPVDPSQKDRGVNLVGSFVALNPESEFFEVLEGWGLGPVRQLFDCATYADYQAMARSRVTIVTRFNGGAGARSMEERLGIPAFDFGPCYDVERIEKSYGGLAQLLDLPAPDCTPWRTQAEARIRETRDLVGDTPVVVDCEASLVPFALARALLAYGFNVTHVFHSHHPFDADTADRVLIAERHPQVVCLPSNDARLHIGDHAGLALPDPGRTVAVGTTGAAIVGTDRTVDVWHDEGLTGFHGVGLLMEKIAHAYRTGGNRG